MKLRHALLQQIELSIAMGVILGYEIDFGWGKPICVSGFFLGWNGYQVLEYCHFYGYKIGDGIDAWVYLLQDEMAMIELGKELLAFATLDQSPLGVR